MSVFILVTSVVICLLFLFTMARKVNNKGYIHWGIGVDHCCFYSPAFSIHNRQITIEGFQEALDKSSRIRYSVIKMNWLGKRKVYGQGIICGDYKNPKYFQLTMKDIPNGKDYQIEIFNDFNISCGQFKVSQG